MKKREIRSDHTISIIKKYYQITGSTKKIVMFELFYFINKYSNTLISIKRQVRIIM